MTLFGCFWKTYLGHDWELVGAATGLFWEFFGWLPGHICRTQSYIRFNNKSTKMRSKPYYAHMLIVVAFLVVQMFSCLVITRYHGVGEVPGYVEMNPISLMERSKPSRDLRKARKPTMCEPTF